MRIFTFSACVLLSAVFFAIGMNSRVDAAQTKQAERTLDAYAPWEELEDVTPGATEYSVPWRGCKVEDTDSGTVVVVDTIKGDEYVTFNNVTVGEIIPAMITRIYASTTADLICGR